MFVYLLMDMRYDVFVIICIIILIIRIRIHRLMLIVTGLLILGRRFRCHRPLVGLKLGGRRKMLGVLGCFEVGLGWFKVWGCFEHYYLLH